MCVFSFLLIKTFPPEVLFQTKNNRQVSFLRSVADPIGGIETVDFCLSLYDIHAITVFKNFTFGFEFLEFGYKITVETWTFHNDRGLYYIILDVKKKKMFKLFWQFFSYSRLKCLSFFCFNMDSMCLISK